MHIVIFDFQILFLERVLCVSDRKDGNKGRATEKTLTQPSQAVFWCGIQFHSRFILPKLSLHSLSNSNIDLGWCSTRILFTTNLFPSSLGFRCEKLCFPATLRSGDFTFVSKTFFRMNSCEISRYPFYLILGTFLNDRTPRTGPAGHPGSEAALESIKPTSNPQLVWLLSHKG